MNLDQGLDLLELWKGTELKEKQTKQELRIAPSILRIAICGDFFRIMCCLFIFDRQHLQCMWPLLGRS